MLRRRPGDGEGDQLAATGRPSRRGDRHGDGRHGPEWRGRSRRARRRRGPTPRRRRRGRSPRQRRSGGVASCASPGRRGRPALSARAGRRASARSNTRRSATSNPAASKRAAARGKRAALRIVAMPDGRRRWCRATRGARRPRERWTRRGGGRGRACGRGSQGAPPGNAMRRTDGRSLPSPAAQTDSGRPFAGAHSHARVPGRRVDVHAEANGTGWSTNAESLACRTGTGLASLGSERCAAHAARSVTATAMLPSLCQRNRQGSSVDVVTVLFATHPLFLEHHTGAHHPERPSRLTAVAERRPPARARRCRRPARTAAGEASRSRAGAPGLVPRSPRTSRRRGGRMDRRRHGDEPAVRVRRRAGRRRRSHRRGGAATRRGRRGVLRRASARPSRHADGLDGILPGVQHRRRRRRARRRGRAGVDLRLRRPSWQRNAGGVLRRSSRPVRQHPPVAAVPGHRPARPRPAPATGAGTTVNIPLPPGTTGDVYLAGVRRGHRPDRRPTSLRRGC